MKEVDIIIIGAGPGGYETAAEAAKMGLRTIIIERNFLGGTCLNQGCIPTKALCKSAELLQSIAEASQFGINVSGVEASFADAAKRKDEIVEALRAGVEMVLKGVEIVRGEARFVDKYTVEVDGEQFTAPKIIIATGSQPAMLPIEGAELAISSDQMLAATSLPKSMCVIGGGVIGMEFASILAAYGTEVTVIEYCKEILPPFDKDISKRLKSLLSRKGVNIITSAAVTAIRPGKIVEYESKGKQLSVECEEVLMAVGRRPVIPAGCAEVGIEVGKRGIVVDDNFMTAIPGVYAIGDVNGVCMLAHAASAQGAAVLGKNVNTAVIPSAVFTNPECSMVGLTEDYCKEKGMSIKVAKSLYRANGKAMTMGDTDGMVKIVIDENSHQILGCHILGAHAADLVQEVATAMANNLTIEAIARTVHIHPSLTEIVLAAANTLNE